VLVAAVSVALVGASCWTVQAVALERPSTAQLELVKTLRSLEQLDGSWGTVRVDGRTYTARCGQHWREGVHIARVELDGLNVATEVGSQLVGRRGPLLSGEFDLAGCPRPLVGWLAGELVRGASVHFHTVDYQGKRLRELVLEPRSLPLDLYVAGSRSLPARLTLSTSAVHGTSLVHYGALR
jgi:hypothetical protein